MNIVFGLMVMASALFLRYKYKTNGELSGRIFAMCMVSGVFMLFSVQTFDNGWLIAMTIVEILLCAALLAVYRAQLIREMKARSKRAAARRQRVQTSHRQTVAVKVRCSAVRAA